MSTAITGISSMATRLFLGDVAEAWQRQSGTPVRFESVGGVDAAKRVQADEAFDVVVLAADAIAKLAAAGKVVAGSERSIVRSDVAIAVQRGAARPAIGNEEQLRAAVLAARSVGYSTGPSGVALKQMCARWGIEEQLGTRLVQAPPGVAVGTLLARGEVELGFQQLSELMHIDGIDVIGPMPAGTEISTIFSGAVCVTSARPEVAASLLDFIRSAATDDAKARHGLQSLA